MTRTREGYRGTSLIRNDPLLTMNTTLSHDVVGAGTGFGLGSRAKALWSGRTKEQLLEATKKRDLAARSRLNLVTQWKANPKHFHPSTLQ